MNLRRKDYADIGHNQLNIYAPEAQLVEALGLYPIGCGFESHGEHHTESWQRG